MEAGADVNAVDTLKVVCGDLVFPLHVICSEFRLQTPLMTACLKSRADVVALLLDKGADFRATNVDDQVCQMGEAERTKLNCVRVQTALMFAAFTGNVDCLRHIVNKFPNKAAVKEAIEAKNSKGLSAIGLAQAKQQKEAVEFLKLQGVKG